MVAASRGCSDAAGFGRVAGEAPAAATVVGTRGSRVVELGLGVTNPVWQGAWRRGGVGTIDSAGRHSSAGVDDAAHSQAPDYTGR